MIDAVRAVAIRVTPDDVSAGVCGDADDLPVLGTAIAGRATVLVTGDKDLLVPDPFRGISILSPRAFFGLHVSVASWRPKISVGIPLEPAAATGGIDRLGGIPRISK